MFSLKPVKNIILGYLRSVVHELSQVSYPTRDRVIADTLTVIGTIGAMVLFLAIVDALLAFVGRPLLS